MKKSGRFEGVSREVHLLQLPPILAPVLFQCSVQRHTEGVCLFVCLETAVGTGWSAAGSRSAERIEHVSGCEGRPRCGCVGGWRDEQRRGGDWRWKTSSCFHLMEANPSVCSPRSIR